MRTFMKAYYTGSIPLFTRNTYYPQMEITQHWLTKKYRVQYTYGYYYTPKQGHELTYDSLADLWASWDIQEIFELTEQPLRQRERKGDE